ncbi:hypothetical protein BKA70DRAFT_1088494 [Coprinopsis sp. MPI-PUGE-AT-0042]|nr:hypothetical protein BKA70DRAFT_1088494 [Coprinopsis sp. MPI-PUGE-AT-0042]
MQLAQLFLFVALSSYSAVAGPASFVPATTLERRVSNSQWSFYNVQSPTACGTFQSDSDFIVALNAQDFGGFPGRHCGKTITLRRNGKTAKAQIRDICVTCPQGGLELTPSLFKVFSPLDAGTIVGDWEFD